MVLAFITFCMLIYWLNHKKKKTEIYQFTERNSATWTNKYRPFFWEVWLPKSRDSMGLSAIITLRISGSPPKFMTPLKTTKCCLSNFILCKDCFDYSESFTFPYKFWNQFLQNPSWDFDRDCIKSIDQFGENCHINNIEPSNQ